MVFSGITFIIRCLLIRCNLKDLLLILIARPRHFQTDHYVLVFIRKTPTLLQFNVYFLLKNYF